MDRLRVLKRIGGGSIGSFRPFFQEILTDLDLWKSSLLFLPKEVGLWKARYYSSYANTTFKDLLLVTNTVATEPKAGLRELARNAPKAHFTPSACLEKRT
ncbi:tRNA (mo5U34)-methyltransferase [Striga asiatica]|uniref:tRNA (Mo5U34)-methyltransferase n=1 Tax=Striga asiatica TaxID=4170 RepID=A0A5A7R0Z2_STRAF|nr:tRNA (mo5U34)-methyltransferase [Striga asiatica]